MIQCDILLDIKRFKMTVIIIRWMDVYPEKINDTPHHLL